MRFSEKVKEFSRKIGLKGKEVLVAGIIGAGILIGNAKAQTADSLVVDTSSVHIDSTFIDWSKPRFMGLTYGYYKKEVEIRYILGEMDDLMRNYGASVDDMDKLHMGLDSLYYAWLRNFPYSTPATRQDTLNAIRYYFEQIYDWSWHSNGLTYRENVQRYITTHPNKAAEILYDLDIIDNSPYGAILLNSKKINQ